MAGSLSRRQRNLLIDFNNPPASRRERRVDMKIAIILTGSGGELDRSEIDIPDDHHDMDEAVNLAASEVIEGWTLSVGDTITIASV
jgi:hypothetical protein